MDTGNAGGRSEASGTGNALSGAEGSGQESVGDRMPVQEGVESPRRADKRPRGSSGFPLGFFVSPERREE